MCPDTQTRTMSPTSSAAGSTNGATITSSPEAMIGRIEFPRGRKVTTAPPATRFATSSIAPTDLRYAGGLVRCERGPASLWAELVWMRVGRYAVWLACHSDDVGQRSTSSVGVHAGHRGRPMPSPATKVAMVTGLGPELSNTSALSARSIISTTLLHNRR